jgi:hypothetical protein
MKQIVVNHEIRSKLATLESAAELCDDSGKVLGLVVPLNSTNGSCLARNEPQWTQDEIQRRRQEPGGRTLAEIWRRLGKP